MFNKLEEVTIQFRTHLPEELQTLHHREAVLYTSRVRFRSLECILQRGYDRSWRTHLHASKSVTTTTATLELLTLLTPMIKQQSHNNSKFGGCS